MEKILESLEIILKPMFRDENTGHDYYHLKRVSELALQIQEKEGGDRLVIGVSGFLHDIHRIIQKESGKYCHPKDSLPAVEGILDGVNAPKDKIPTILHCIEFHEESNFSSKGRTVHDLETLILQDADNIDGIGAIGIVRGFTYCGVNKVPIWIPEEPLYKKKFDLTENDVSEIHHFHTRLLRMKDDMNTETARKIALGRHQFMELFLEQFFQEWEGKK